ncbi:hypothetical protein JCM14076_09930 [Methylosoma difficile]
METYLINYINKVVLFRVEPDFVKDCLSLLQTHETARGIYGLLVAVDSLGCWVANEKWETINAKTNIKSQHNTHILIPWRSLVSVAVFPERVFDGFAEEKDARSIGFHAQL